MIPADYPFELRASPTTRSLPRALRVFGVAISLGVHVAVLLHLLRPVQPMAPFDRRPEVDASLMQVFLLDTSPAIVKPATVPPLVPKADVERTADSRALRATRPTSTPEPPRPAAVIAADAPISAAQLFGGIEGAANELTASDRPLAGAGMPSAHARLPGSSAPIVDLPVHFVRRTTPKQLAMKALRMVVGTTAANPDDMESVRNLHSPLQDLTDAHIGHLREPECNDPDDPLHDPRCAQTPTR